MLKKTVQSAPSPLSPTIFPFWLAFASHDLLSAFVLLYHLHRFRKYTIVQPPAVSLLGLIWNDMLSSVREAVGESYGKVYPEWILTLVSDPPWEYSSHMGTCCSRKPAGPPLGTSWLLQTNPPSSEEEILTKARERTDGKRKKECNK